MKAEIFLRIVCTAFLLSGIFPSAQAKRIKTQASKDTLTILSFNDFHGAFQAEGDVPGAARLSATIAAMRKSLPNLMVVAGGDNYSGGYFSRITQGEPLPAFFENCQVEFSAIGNHEFDWGIPAMVERLNWGKTRYLAANIFLAGETESSAAENKERKEQSARPLDQDRTGSQAAFPNKSVSGGNGFSGNQKAPNPQGKRPDWAMPYAIKHDTLRNGTPLRLAFIGLSTQETKTAASPEIVAELDFANPVPVASGLRELLQDSADLFLLLTHIGTDTRNGQIVFTDKDVDGLSRIPGIDGIITGHSHKKVCGLKDSVPVVQAHNYGRKVALLQYEISQDKKGRISHRFLGARLVDPGTAQDPAMADIVEKYLNDPRYHFQEIVCHNPQALNPEDLIGQSGFTALGSLVTQAYEDCYRSLTKADSDEIVIGVCNYGAIRTVLPQGDISRLQAGNILPFGGVLNAFHLNGKQLHELLQYGINEDKGWLQYHNMEIRLQEGRITEMAYLKDGKRSPIQDTGSYTVVTENFLSSGGDGYPVSVFQDKDAEFAKTEASLRNPTDVFIDYLKKLGEPQAGMIQTPVLKIGVGE